MKLFWGLQPPQGEIRPWVEECVFGRCEGLKSVCCWETCVGEDEDCVWLCVCACVELVGLARVSSTSTRHTKTSDNIREPSHSARLLSSSLHCRL